MFGFGKKKISVPAITEVFFQRTCEELTNSLPTIRQSIEMMGIDLKSLEDGWLHFVLLPAAIAFGLQPVRNIWDNTTFERAHREVVRLIEGVNHPEVSNQLTSWLNEYLIVWSSFNPMEGGNMPWDEVAARVLIRLDTARTTSGQTAIKNSLIILTISSILGTLPGKFWRNVEKTFKLI